MFSKTPTTHFLTCGAAEGATRRNALDAAWLQTGLGKTCRVRTTAVIPPGCQLVDATPMPEGSRLPVSWANIESDTPGEVISAGVAVAYPSDPARAAVVMEYAAAGHKEDIEAIVRRMADEAIRRRGLELKIIHSVAVQHRVERIGSVVAAVVLSVDKEI